VQHVAPVTGEIPIEIAERGDGDGEREERVASRKVSMIFIVTEACAAHRSRWRPRERNRGRET